LGGRGVKLLTVIYLVVSLGCSDLCFLKAAGLGRLRPNTLVIGFKNDWKDGDMMNVETYIQMIQ
jgi:hypothetical protein